MVDRTSQPFELNVQNAAAPGELNLGAGRYTPPSDSGPSTGEQALDGLLQIGQQYLGKKIPQLAQQAYIEGQRARMAGLSQEAVSTDIFSAPFVNGGYQDEDYRIEQANMARDINNFIDVGNGKTMSPEDFSKVVRERAAQYSDKFNNLSAQGQLQSTASQQKMEEALFTKQATAYQKWSIDQGAKRFTSQGNQITTDLINSDTPASRQANTERAALFYIDLLTTNKLPEQQRSEMAKNYLASLVNSDQRGVINQLQASGMLDSLSFEDRKALDAAMRESKARTEASDSLGVILRNGELESRVATGDVTVDELKGYIATEIAAQRMSYDQAKALATRYATGLGNKDDMIDLARDVGNGNITGIVAKGFNVNGALEKVDQQLAKNGVTTPDRLKYGIQAGVRMGTIPKSFGETIGQAIRGIQATPDGQPVNAELVSSLNNTVTTLIAAEQTNPGARGVLLNAMPDDTKLALSYALSQQEKGVAPEQALKEFAVNRDAFAKLDSIQQSFTTQAFRKELMDRVQNESSSGFFGRIGNALTGQSNLSPNSRNNALWTAAIQDELGQLTMDRNNMGATPEALLDVAVSNVRGRLIEVGEPGFFGQGDQRRPLILPRGVTADQVFGSADIQSIGKQLNKMYPKPADGFETNFQFNRVMGRLEQVDYDEKGIAVRVTPVDAKAVGKAVNDDKERIIEESRAALFGKPVLVGGIEMQIDGDGSQGIPVKLVYGFRKELAQMEGLRLDVYKDRNGLAVGVGRNVTGQMKEGDKITLEQAEQWYREDTDRAMGQANRVADQLGVRDYNSRLGLAGAIYQLGDSGLAEHKRTADAIRNHDYNAFVQEVRSSEWAKQTPERAEWFIKKMAGHFAP